MRISLTSVFVDDQRAALAFYTDVLGFTKRRDIPIGSDAWLTVVSPESPGGPELLLEPASHPAVKPYRDALVKDGIPLAQFAVDDVETEHARLTAKGVTFTQPPTDIGAAVVAVFDDTCGNLVQLVAEKPGANLGPAELPLPRNMPRTDSQGG
jgi:predicted enzyme related to lactoylglutathione lyase